MKFLRSIRWRLQVWYGSLLAVMLSGFGIAVYQFEKFQAISRLDDQLLERTSLLTNGLRPRSREPDVIAATGPGKRLRLSDAEAAHFQGDGQFYYAIWLHNGAPLTLSPGAPSDIPEPSLPEASGLLTRGEWRESFLKPAPGDCVLVGASLQPIHAALRHFALVVSIVVAAVFGTAIVIGSWFIQKALKPIDAITTAAAKIASGDLAQRINIAEAESELGELAGILNATFGRLDEAFARQARFTADAAHELRTPISVIITHVQNGLNATDLAEEQREVLDACHRAAQRMRRLITSLLQLARLDSGEEQLMEVCDVPHLAVDAVELMSPLAAEHKVELRTNFQPMKWKGDADRLSQVLTNLLSNAIHYNRRGGHVLIATRVEKNYGVCVISDSGRGIPAEYLPRIFERFFRVDKARDGSSGRLGLGLAICKSIIDAHGGRIEVESTLGEGATFTLRLPLA